MELELCKETYSCYEALPPLVETREQSTETIVPDYCPDIARIVEGSGCLFVRSREIADGRVSVSGSLRVTLLYIADGSGGLKSFSYTLPVEETLDGRLREGCTEASVSGCVSALEVRALNPRKIMTRAAVELTVTPYCAAQLTACGDVTQRAENGIETLCETQEVSIIKALRSKDFVFSDDLVLSSSKEPAAELLRESASVRTTECRLIGGKIILKGVVCVEVLYLSESGTICSAAAELPFSQIVEGVEDADENTSAEAMLCLTGAELRIGGESGDARTISAKLFLHAFVVLRQRLCLRCITDLYSTSCDLSAQMQTLELCGGVETVTQEQNVREQIETGVEVSAVLCAEVHFGSVSLVQEESTANVRCTAILRVLYLDEGGAPLMVERRTEVAARIAVPEGCTAAVRSVTACEVSAAATADGIEVRFPALFTLECTRRCRCACLCALKAEPQQESGGRQPTLVLRALGAKYGFDVDQLPPVEVGGHVVSSTCLRELIGKGDVTTAASLLGHAYGCEGLVVHGEGRGTGLGFPTANIAIPDTMLPAPGVYATRVVVPHLGRTLQAVTNIGRKPTFGDYGLSIESFLLDTDLNLYGNELRLDFVARLRDEKRFESADALVAQIRTDVARARDLLTMYF